MTPEDKFNHNVCDEIERHILSTENSSANCSICLTGGRSARSLYSYKPTQKIFCKYFGYFYFGDERCVGQAHPESNYQLAYKTLFLDYPFLSDAVYRVHGEAENLLFEAERYAVLLPENLDVLLFSMGEDGHIASLFPGSPALYSDKKVVYIHDAPKLPSKRITITPSVIHAAKQVIVMAAGAEKGRVLAKALEEPDNIAQLPVRLTIGATWVLDRAATNSFKKYTPSNKYSTRIIYV